MSGSESKSERGASCTVDDPLQLAARIMCDNDCSTVPVVDAEGAIIGLITARDICVAAYRRCLPLWHMDVGSAMSERTEARDTESGEPSGTHSIARIRNPEREADEPAPARRAVAR
jgi:CBS domain-containing protein